MQLAENLLREYGPTFCRPVSNVSQTTIVEMVLSIKQILEVVSMLIDC